MLRPCLHFAVISKDELKPHHIELWCRPLIDNLLWPLRRALIWQPVLQSNCHCRLLNHQTLLMLPDSKLTDSKYCFLPVRVTLGLR